MSVEDYMHKNIDKAFKKERHKREDILKSSEKIIKNNDNFGSIKEDDFRDIYGDDEVDKDLEEVKNRKDKWEEEENQDEEFSRRYSDVLETVLADLSNGEDWLGSDIKVSKASEFDDQINETDLIFELGGSDNVLGVQLTFAEMYGKVEDKVESVVEEVEKGSLSEIKYFESKFEEDKKEHLEKIPRVVVAVSFEDVTKLVQFWAGYFEDGIESFKEALNNSPMQADILLQITEGLEAMTRLSRLEDKNDLVDIFSKRLDKIEKILDKEKFEELKTKQKETESSRLTEIRRIYNNNI